MPKGFCRLAGALALVGLPAWGQGPGDLGITPHRIVFAGRVRTAQVTLINQAATTATYRIGFLEMRMGEDGQLTEIREAGPGERFADELLRFSPRQVTLAPGATQTIRLLLRKPDGLAPGEYRSHLVFQSVPAQEGADAEAPAASAQGVEVRLTPIFRIAIPVLVRQGDLEAGAALSDLALRLPENAADLPRLSCRLFRTGARSLYGDLTATYAPAAGEERTVATIKGLALYAPAAARRLEIALEVPPGLELRGGRLRLRFAESVASGQAADAQAEIALP